MIKKIVHVSDIHITPYKHHNLFRSQLTKFIDDLKVKLNGVNHEEIRIVLTGDIVDKKISVSNELNDMLAWFFNELLGIGFVVILPVSRFLSKQSRKKRYFESNNKSYQ